MNANKKLARLVCALPGAGLALMLAAAPIARASTVWSGPTTNYTMTSGNNGTAATQDRLTSDCWLTRNGSEPMFNAALPYNEGSYNFSTSPENTLWALGTLANTNLTYQAWADVIGGGGGRRAASDISSFSGETLAQALVGKQFVVHIVSDDIFLSVKFTGWDPGFSYTRSTPAVGAPAPTVSITTPANGATFSAPAVLHLAPPPP